MTTSFYVFGYKAYFTFKYRFSNSPTSADRIIHWNDYRLGIWFKRSRVLSKPDDGPAVLGRGGTHSNRYAFGVDLVICKLSASICYKPFEIEI